MGDLRVGPEVVSGTELPENHKETALGLLPDEWQIVPLEEVADFTRKPRGLNFSAVPVIPFIPMESIPADGSSGTEFFAKSGDSISSGTYCEAGDVLLAKITPSFENGKQGMVPMQVPDGYAVATTEVYPLKPKPDRLNDYFLFSYLRFQPIRRDLASKMEGSTGRQRLPKHVLRRLLLPLPPLSEQQAIAHVLRTIQKAIETTEEVIESTRELKRSLMNHLFTYGPVPVDEAEQVPLKETEVGAVPEHWEMVELGSVADVRSGGTPSKKRPDFWEGRIPWASPKDLKRLRLSDSQDHISTEALEDGSKLAPIGTVLVVVRGMILAKDVPVAITEVPMAFNQDLKALLPHDSIDAEYLLYSMIARKKALAREIGTSAHGTRRIGSSALEKWLLPLPDKDEQQIIVRFLSALDRKSEVEESRKQSLEVLFKTLLHNLMTGKVRVKDLDFSELEEMV